ncbi:MAG: transcriptional repressor NrdR [wastewater metagenome]|nr:transcriptional repressor NrdR [Candidatus Loosdrechtia aerotolerans]
MQCLFCKVDNDKVINSRTSVDGLSIKRRRECLGCGRRYTTYERIEENPLRVVKKDGRREMFDRNKILTGLMKACEKRLISTDTLEDIVNEIEREVYNKFDREVDSSFIGSQIMQKLKALDMVAYVRFASVYREFKDISEFIDELKPFINNSGKKKKEEEDNENIRSASIKH